MSDVGPVLAQPFHAFSNRGQRDAEICCGRDHPIVLDFLDEIVFGHEQRTGELVARRQEDLGQTQRVAQRARAVGVGRLGQLVWASAGNAALASAAPVAWTSLRRERNVLMVLSPANF